MNNHSLENKVVLELSKPVDINKNFICKAFTENIDYAYILGQLLFNRVGGTAYLNLKKCDILSDINREFRNPLYMIYESGCLKNESFIKAENKLYSIFSGVDFRYSFLKGALLCKIYAPGTRTSNDFDILISKKDVEKITSLLRSEGFEQGFLKNDTFRKATRQEIIYSLMNKGETVPFVKRISYPNMEWLEIDVNFSLDFKSSDSYGVIDDFLNRSEKIIETCDGNLSTLNPIDFMIHLCVHLYKEATIWHWVNICRDLSIYKFCDIYLIWKKYSNSLFAENITNLIIQYNLQKECCYALYYTKLLFEIDDYLLDSIIQKILPDNKIDLKKVFDPGTKKEYYFDIDFIDYLFCSNRKNHLKKVQQT